MTEDEMVGMVLLTRWTWVWASFRGWWWTGKPGVLQSMGLQRVGHDWATEPNNCQWYMQCSKNLNSFLFPKSELLVVNPGCPLKSPGKPVKPNNQATRDTDAVKLLGSGWGPGSRGLKSPLWLRCVASWGSVRKAWNARSSHTLPAGKSSELFWNPVFVLL